MIKSSIALAELQDKKKAVRTVAPTEIATINVER